MRPIKFRAWTKKTNKMIDLYKITPLALNESANDNDGIFIPFHENLILMQFTGLTDRNGKEIYEGDVLKYEMDPWGTVPWIVIFKDGAFKKEIQNTWYRQTDLNSDLSKYEVIGNIYENPDLLGVPL